MGGLSGATASETDATIAGKIRTAHIMTVISWCTYPVVYFSPCLAFLHQRQWSPFSLDTVFQTSSPSAVLAWSSTRSPMPNPSRKVRVSHEILTDSISDFL